MGRTRGSTHPVFLLPVLQLEVAVAGHDVDPRLGEQELEVPRAVLEVRIPPLRAVDPRGRRPASPLRPIPVTVVARILGGPEPEHVHVIVLTVIRVPHQVAVVVRDTSSVDPRLIGVGEEDHSDDSGDGFLREQALEASEDVLSLENREARDDVTGFRCELVGRELIDEIVQESASLLEDRLFL